MNKKIKTLFKKKRPVGKRHSFLLGIYFIFSVLLALLTRQALGGDSNFYNIGLLLFVAFIVWLVLFELLLLFASKKEALYINGIILLLFSVFFIRSLPSFIGVIILAIGVFEAHRRAFSEREINLKFNSIKIIKTFSANFFNLLFFIYFYIVCFFCVI